MPFHDPRVVNIPVRNFNIRRPWTGGWSELSETVNNGNGQESVRNKLESPIFQGVTRNNQNWEITVISHRRPVKRVNTGVTVPPRRAA